MGHSFVSLLFPGPAYFLRHSNTDIWLTNNPTMTSKCSKGRKSHMSLTLNQKLQQVKPWWGRHVKSQDRLKAGLPGPHGQLGNAEENFLKETKSASLTSCEKWKSEDSLTAASGGSFGGLRKRSDQPQQPLGQSLIQARPWLSSISGRRREVRELQKKSLSLAEGDTRLQEPSLRHESSRWSSQSWGISYIRLFTSSHKDR